MYNLFKDEKMNRVIMIVLALLLPPIAVLIKEGIGKHLLINIVLCLLFYFPGMVHAIWVVTRNTNPFDRL